jgi:hypothetical protein
MVMIEPSGTTGGCACGAIRFSARGQPYRVGLCHCLDCRKQHGAPFSASAIFPAGQVTFTGDEPGSCATSERYRHHFCRRCGSPVCSREEGSDEIELFTGSFDATDLFPPTYESWTIRREEWLPPIPSVRHRYARNRAGQGRSEARPAPHRQRLSVRIPTSA